MRLRPAGLLLVLCACSSSPPGSGDAGPPLACDAGLLPCASGCARVELDDKNCGTCGNACQATEGCAGGHCLPHACTDKTCGPGLVCADSACVDPRCFAVVCPMGEACANGSCFSRTCATLSCLATEVCVADTCQDASCVGVLCPAGLRCVGGVCRTDTCDDGLKNGTESDSDCGGICARCTVGRTCGGAADCLSLSCNAGRCAAPSCTDSVRNGDEGDVDCGGSTCPRCADGRRCTEGAHCESQVCAQGTCRTPSCTDSVGNGAETDVDCGGGTCPRCDGGQGCAAGTDCVTGLCGGGRCLSAQCMNGMKDGVETGVDCGGGCAGCVVGGMCLVGSDCASKSCHPTSHLCIAATCTDLVQNGNETDLDCGANCPPCAVGLHCDAGASCQSASCVMGTCRAATCTDQQRNATESDVDCGGDGGCPRCVPGRTCGSPSDCASAFCDAGTCSPLGLFAAPVPLDAGASPVDLVLADLDNDGRKDLAVTNYGGYEVIVYFSNGDGTFAPVQAVQVSGANGARNPRGLAAGDFDGDGRLDLVQPRDNIRFCGGSFSYDMGGCTLTFIRSAPGRAFYAPVDTYYPLYLEPSNFSGCGETIATGRFDSDGRDDVLTGDGIYGSGQYHCGNGTPDVKGGWTWLMAHDAGTSFEKPSLFPLGGPWVTTGDVNNDGKVDLVGHSERLSEMRIALGNGMGGFAAPLVVPVSPGAGPVALARIDGDANLDVLVVSRATQRLAIARGLGDGMVLAPQSYPVVDPDGLDVGDFDGDGKPDVVVGARGVSVLKGNGDGTVQAADTYFPAQLGDVGDVAVADFNSDGKLDVACVANGRVWILLNVRP